MRKFKVICTGISGINGKLTPEMGTLEEWLLPKESFEKLVSDKAIIEIIEENKEDIQKELDKKSDEAIARILKAEKERIAKATEESKPKTQNKSKKKNAKK